MGIIDLPTELLLRLENHFDYAEEPQAFSYRSALAGNIIVQSGRTKDRQYVFATTGVSSGAEKAEIFLQCSDNLPENKTEQIRDWMFDVGEMCFRGLYDYHFMFLENPAFTSAFGYGGFVFKPADSLSDWIRLYQAIPVYENELRAFEAIPQLEESQSFVRLHSATLRKNASLKQSFKSIQATIGKTKGNFFVSKRSRLINTSARIIFPCLLPMRRMQETA